MKIFEAGKYFLEKCNAKNLATQTLDNYAYRLKVFVTFLLSKEITDIDDISEAILIEYFNSLKTQKLSPVTISGHFTVVRAFLNTLFRDSFLTINPIAEMKKPKTPKIIVRAFNQDEVHELLDIFDRNTFLGFRNYTIFSVLFGTGIRLSELLRIQLYDINFTENYIRIFGKGDKERLIPLGNSLKRVILNYLKKRKTYIIEGAYPSTPYLFIAKNGYPLTKSGMNMIYSNIKKSKKSWSTRLSSHTWRHTFAKYFLLNGGDLFSLKEILGHEDVSTTMIYLNMNIKELIMQNNKYNPLENRRWRYF